MNEFRSGLIAGIPIALGYLSVSFSIGLLAAGCGMTAWQSAILSATNLTSAGEAAGIQIIAAGGSLIELAITQLVINLRYALMALSLTQKLSKNFTTHHRLVAAFGITDEIFGVSASRPKPITPPYLYGMISIATFFWILGTVLGSVAGEIFPPALSSALGIMLYGMFIAIIIPAAKKDRHVLFVILLAACFSISVHFLLPEITSGFSVIVCSIASAVIASLIFPLPEENFSQGGSS